MITIDKVTYRNLQEQVQANKEAIEAFTNVEFTLNNMGIRVLGKVNQPSDIPIGTREFGDAYLVGISEPYDIWIYTRTSTPDVPGVFINMGPLNIVGPEGAQGPQGPQGEQGADGYAPVIRYGSGAPVLQPTDKNGYVYVDTNNSNLYTFDNGWKFVVSTRGPAGPQGPQGIQGATGTTLSIVGKLASESLLPTDFASGNILKNTAYLVTKSNATHLYIIMGNQNDYSTWYWQDVGDFNLGSIIYKNNEFQYSIDMSDNFTAGESHGYVITDIAANKLYTELNNKVKTNTDNIASNTIQIGALNNNFTELNTYAREKLELHDNQISNAQTQISNLEGEITNTNTNIGDLASLATDDKSSIVTAINELHTDITNTNTNLSAESAKVGDLANLATNDKTNIVAAINEVKNSGGGSETLITEEWTINGTNKLTVPNVYNRLSELGDKVKYIDIEQYNYSSERISLDNWELSITVDANGNATFSKYRNTTQISGRKARCFPIKFGYDIDRSQYKPITFIVAEESNPFYCIVNFKSNLSSILLQMFTYNRPSGNTTAAEAPETFKLPSYSIKYLSIGSSYVNKISITYTE